MAIFNYVAKENNGKNITGTVEAGSDTAALALLKSKGLYVIRISRKEGETFDEYLANLRGVPEGEKVAFTRQLATMVAAGLPLPKSLEVLIGQTSNAKMRQIITECLRDVEGGTPLSASVGKYPNVFSPTYRSLLRAGEASGKMQEILLKLADTMEAAQDLKSKFKAALIYPAIVSIAMVGVFVIMMVFVIPKLSSMYASLNTQLPLPTRIMLAISGFMIKFWWLLILIVIGLYMLLKFYRRTPSGREFFSKLSFAMPILGPIAKEKELTEFTQTLSLLVGSGIPIVEALHISADVVENVLYKRALDEAAVGVEKGYPLSKIMRSDKNFPPIVSSMIAVGEETGQLDTVLERLSHYFESNADTAIKGLSTAMEPIILIVLGFMVGVMVLSIITPIYKLTSSL